MVNCIKRFKNNCERCKCFGNRTLFEDLSNEIIYEVFEYLHSHHAYESFYHLNRRFQNLFTHSHLPISINISSISKETLRNYSRDIIERHPDRIQAIRLSNFWTMGVSTDLLPMRLNFTQLRALAIDDIESEYVEELIDSLSSLPCLRALHITCIDRTKQSNRIYQKIFRLPTLEYLQIKVEIDFSSEMLPLATNQVSSIEHLVISNAIELDEVDRILSYVPKLRHLSLSNLLRSHRNQTQRTPNILIHLNSVSLRVYSIEFDDFELLIGDFFTQVSRLSVFSKSPSLYLSRYLDAPRWERLISASLPNLRLFDFQYEMSTNFTYIDRQTFENQVRQFESVFWTTRQWFFEHCYYSNRWSESALFFSTNPYRKSNYILGNGLPDQNHSTMRSVKQPCIHAENGLKTFSGYFPNVTGLCLSSEFNVKRKSLIIDLGRLLPLRHLTVLILHCHRFPFEQVIELLSLAPHLHTLRLDAVLLYRTKSTLIEQSDLFRLVSSTNTVSHLTINQRITLEKIQLVTALFPRLQCLTIYLANDDLQPIVRFLCTKHRLSLLYFIRRNTAFYQDLERFLSAEKLLHDYTLKCSNEQVCLWW